MALTNEDLLAISQLLDVKLDQKLDQKLQPINSRLSKIENRLDVIELKHDRTAQKLEDLQLDIKISEKNIKRAIHDLNDEMETVIEIMKMNDMLPR